MAILAQGGFSIQKIINGTDPLIYSLLPTDTVITKDSSAAMPAVTSCRKMLTIGNRTEVIGVDSGILYPERNLLVGSNAGWTNSNYAIVYPWIGNYKPQEGEIVSIVVKGTLGEGKTHIMLYQHGGIYPITKLENKGDYHEAIGVPWCIGGSTNDRVTLYAVPKSVTSESTIEWIKIVPGVCNSRDWVAAPEDMRIHANGWVNYADGADYQATAAAKQIQWSLVDPNNGNAVVDRQTTGIVSKGDNALSVVLSNENHSFAGDTSKAIAGSTTCKVSVYKGDTAIPCVIGAIGAAQGLPTGMTIVKPSTAQVDPVMTITVSTQMVTRQGTIKIPITADGKTFDKEFSYSLALKGETGNDGQSVYSLDLTNEMDSVLCDYLGNLIADQVLPSTTVALYLGTTKLTSGVSLSLLIKEGAGTFNVTQSTGLITLATITTDKLVATISATHNGAVRGSADFSITKQKAAKDGQDAYKIELLTEHSSISKSNTGVLTPSVTSAKRLLTIGNRTEVIGVDPPILYPERNLLVDGNAGWTNSNYTIANPWLGNYKPIEGEIVSIIVKGTLGEGKTKFMVYNSGGIVGIAELVSKGDYHEAIGVRWRINGVANTRSTIYVAPSTVTSESTIEWIKIVPGVCSSRDWTPAPEDAVVTAEYSDGTAITPTYANGVYTTPALNPAKTGLKWSLKRNATEIDSETLPVVTDGAKGDKGDTGVPGTDMGVNYINSADWGWTDYNDGGLVRKVLFKHIYKSQYPELFDQQLTCALHQSIQDFEWFYIECYSNNQHIGGGNNGRKNTNPVTFSCPANADRISINIMLGSVVYTQSIKAKLEIGPKASAWTPCPFEVKSDVEYLMDLFPGSINTEATILAKMLGVKQNDQVTSALVGGDSDMYMFSGANSYQTAETTADFLLMRNGEHRIGLMDTKRVDTGLRTAMRSRLTGTEVAVFDTNVDTQVGSFYTPVYLNPLLSTPVTYDLTEGPTVTNLWDFGGKPPFASTVNLNIGEVRFTTFDDSWITMFFTGTYGIDVPASVEIADVPNHVGNMMFNGFASPNYYVVVKDGSTEITRFHFSKTGEVGKIKMRDFTSSFQGGTPSVVGDDFRIQIELLLDASTVSKTNLRYNKAVTNVGTLSLYYDLIHNTDMDMVMEITECHLYNLSPVRDTLGYRDYTNAKGYLFGKDGVLQKASDSSYWRQNAGIAIPRINVEGRGLQKFDLISYDGKGLRLSSAGLQYTENGTAATPTYHKLNPLILAACVSSNMLVKNKIGLLGCGVSYENGVFTITHNYGSTAYVVTATPNEDSNTNIGICSIGVQSANTFTVKMVNLSGASLQKGFNFTMNRV